MSTNPRRAASPPMRKMPTVPQHQRDELLSVNFDLSRHHRPICLATWNDRGAGSKRRCPLRQSTSRSALGSIWRMEFGR